MAENVKSASSKDTIKNRIKTEIPREVKVLGRRPETQAVVVVEMIRGESQGKSLGIFVLNTEL